MSKLSSSQVYALLLQGGFTPHQATIMTAIAQAESARNPGAIGDVGLENHTWGPSVGLFQIRTLKSETGTGSDRDIEHLMGNPAAQVQAALHISGNGNNYHPWSTYTHGTYRQFLDEPLQGGATLPDFGPGSGTDHAGAASAAQQLAVTDPFGIDKGVSPAAVVDSDGDGLTDQFEQLLGTDPHQADTDHDGLSDAYETTVSHTDPLSADTDHDGITDGTELAEGSDPGHAALPAAAQAAGFGGMDTLDSDHDGLSDGYEHRLGTDPFAADSDHDGVPDGLEVARGTNPLSADSDHDGLTDGFAADHGLGTDSADDPATHDVAH